METYNFPSPGKAFKKVKVVKLRLCNNEGVECDHQVGVYLSTAGTPSFCIALPDDYYRAWSDHPTEGIRRFSRSTVNKNLSGGMIAATSFDDAIDALNGVSAHWKEHHANRSMEKCIFITLEIKSKTKSIAAPSFSDSESLIGMRVRWGYSVGGREYQHRNSIDDPLTAPQPAFNDLSIYQGGRHGKNVTLPFTAELWQELLKIQETLERAAERLALLANEDTAINLLTSMAAGMPLLAAKEQA